MTRTPRTPAKKPPLIVISLNYAIKELQDARAENVKLWNEFNPDIIEGLDLLQRMVPQFQYVPDEDSIKTNLPAEPGDVLTRYPGADGSLTIKANSFVKNLVLLNDQPLAWIDACGELTGRLVRAPNLPQNMLYQRDPANYTK